MSHFIKIVCFRHQMCRNFLVSDRFRCSVKFIEMEVKVLCNMHGRSRNYRTQTKLREGYVFTGVCDSVHRGSMGGCGGRGACMVVGGACVVVGGCAWLLEGVCGCWGM